jgi:N utilization substance protein B
MLRGAIKDATALEARIQPCLDRPLGELSPVERAILLLATYEFVHHVEIPYRVVINEAIELAKGYGGTDGYKYVNGVLDKLAAQVRTLEVTGSKPA